MEQGPLFPWETLLFQWQELRRAWPLEKGGPLAIFWALPAFAMQKPAGLCDIISSHRAIPLFILVACRVNRPETGEFQHYHAFPS